MYDVLVFDVNVVEMMETAYLRGVAKISTSNRQTGT